MMLFDLHSPADMSPTVGMLYSAVRQNFTRLQSITLGMSQRELDYKGINHGFNSTAQLIRHLSRVDLNWVYRIRNESIQSELNNRFGPMLDVNGRLPDVEGVTLEQLLSDYECILTELEVVCISLSDADLTRIVSFGHECEKEATIRWGLWHIADHSRYHQAHINLLRRWNSECLQNNGK